MRTGGAALVGYRDLPGQIPQQPHAFPFPAFHVIGKGHTCDLFALGPFVTRGKIAYARALYKVPSSASCPKLRPVVGALQPGKRDYVATGHRGLRGSDSGGGRAWPLRSHSVAQTVSSSRNPLMGGPLKGHARPCLRLKMCKER